MVMTEACIHVAGSAAEPAEPGHLHDRMPVILKPEDWGDWLDGAPDDAGLLCRPYPDLMVCERTSEG
jgi:putative SOS response-associated peptidase YedK